MCITLNIKIIFIYFNCIIGQYKKIVVNEMNKKYNAKNIKVKTIVRGLRRNRKSLKIPNIGKYLIGIPQACSGGSCGLTLLL